jgi:hypothetical protein
MLIVLNFRFLRWRSKDIDEAQSLTSSSRHLISSPPSSKSNIRTTSRLTDPKDKSLHGCLAQPNLQNSDIVIVVKTGATEAFQKLPTQLLTFLSCAKEHVLIFSDMEQEIAGHHVYDALVDVVEAAKVNHSDFDLYDSQKQYKLMGENIGAMGDKGKEAWALDKYKNIHTAQKAWELRPGKSWYFFVDTDTYVVWSSLTAWLKQQDPNKRLYLGSQVDTQPRFAHGGSGYVLSRGAMKQLVGKDLKEVAANFDVTVKDDCCGDVILARSLAQKEILLTNWYPLINGEKPRGVGFGPKIWCQPVITFYYMGAEDINEMWQFEQARRDPKVSLFIYLPRLRDRIPFQSSLCGRTNAYIVFCPGATPFQRAILRLFGACVRICRVPQRLGQPIKRPHIRPSYRRIRKNRLPS